MAVNSEAIHGCNASPLPPQSWGAVTSKGKSLYLLVFDWPTEFLEVGGLLSTPTSATLLTPQGKIQLESKRINEKDVMIVLPPDPANSAASVIRLEFDEIPIGANVRLLSSQHDNQLLAFDAELRRGDKVGMRAAGFGYRDGKRDNYAVYRWKDTDQWMNWEVRVNEPTRFDVSLRYGICKGGKYELSIGDWKVEQTAATCEGAIPWITKPHIDELGHLLLSAGVHKIELRLTQTNSDEDETLRPLALWLKPSAGEVEIELQTDL